MQKQRRCVDFDILLQKQFGDLAPKRHHPDAFQCLSEKEEITTLFGQIGLTKIGVIVVMTNKKAVASGLVRGPMAAMDWSLENA